MPTKMPTETCNVPLYSTVHSAHPTAEVLHLELSLEQHSQPTAYPAPPGVGTPASSVLAALAYADLFDYPLRVQEIYRYQAGTSCTLHEIEHALGQEPILQELSSCRDGFYFLRGRDHLPGVRLRREAQSAQVWARARLYGRLLRHLPFVRMIAVTGALAVSNLGAVPDIDLLVVCAEGRVWLCRRLLIAIVRVARLFGDDLCPNYIIAEGSLQLDQRDFFTAHELAQMSLLSGHETYSNMLSANRWALDFLPAGFTSMSRMPESNRRSFTQRLFEPVLRMPVFSGWERWELRRMRAKLRPLIGSSAEVVCSASQCKGHTGLNRQKVLERYASRLGELGVLDSLPPVLQACLRCADV